MVAKQIGIEEGERNRARRFDSEDPKRAAALQFAHEVWERRGHVSDEAFTRVREVGYCDAEILEIIAKVVEVTLTNYINDSVHTEVDSPVVVEARGSGR